MPNLNNSVRSSTLHLKNSCKSEVLFLKGGGVAVVLAWYKKPVPTTSIYIIL